MDRVEKQNLIDDDRVEKITTSTETREEIRHRLFIEKVTLFASLTGLTGLFITLISIIFLHENETLIASSSALLQTLAGGFIGYLVKK